MSPKGERHQHKAVSHPQTHPTLLLLLPQPGYNARNWCVDGSSKTPQLILLVVPFQPQTSAVLSLTFNRWCKVETLQSDGTKTQR